MKNNLYFEILCLLLIIGFSMIYYQYWAFSLIVFAYLLYKLNLGTKNNIMFFGVALALFTDIHIFNLSLHSRNIFDLKEVFNIKDVSPIQLFIGKLVALATYAIIATTFIRFKKIIRWQYIFPLFLIAIYSFSKLKHEMSALTYVIWASCLLIFSKNIYYITQNNRINLKGNEKIQLINLVQPFWFNINEVNYYPSETNSQENKSALLNRAINIISTSIIFYLFLIIYFSLAYYVKNNSLKLTTDLYYLNNYSFSAIKDWRNQSTISLNLEIFHIGLSFIFHTFFIGPRILIAMANLIGIQTKDYIDSPWKSNSFNEFFTRTMVYYNMIINLNFYYPFMSITAFLPSQLRKYLNLNLALILGGFIVHLFKDCFRLFSLSFVDFFYFEMNTTLPYLVILSFLITLSQILSSKKIKSFGNFQWMKFIFYIYIYSLTLPFTMSKYIGSFLEVLIFYKKLFFL